MLCHTGSMVLGYGIDILHSDTHQIQALVFCLPYKCFSEISYKVLLDGIFVLEEEILSSETISTPPLCCRDEHVTNPKYTPRILLDFM